MLILLKRLIVDLKGRKQIDNTENKNVFVSIGIIWKIIEERSLRWGGFWKRQAQKLEAWLKKIVGRSSLSLKVEKMVFRWLVPDLSHNWTAAPYSPFHSPSPNS
ncbi:hypothetical protein NPIL_190831 [Nephila pilipes]|uniref:Uncharacterized protein n=1 Tax=Nephila pilipes TaxID=299642 RepID=A0A8X6QXZ5_NEPPI|nr:hypothetical protein NPIL_190831 [Nephila pilipes]